MKTPTKGHLFWITGLCGSGKTSIGKELYKLIRRETENVVFLDGDELRKKFGAQENYDAESRKKLAHQYVENCNELINAGKHVVIATISLFREILEKNRKIFPLYTEVYLKVSLETLVQRDQKNLYSKKEKNLTGVDLIFDEPQNPDCVVFNEGHQTPIEIASTIFEKFYGQTMKQGDFTKLAKAYVNRPGYSCELLDELMNRCNIQSTSTIAEIGAGTGKLTTLLLDKGFSIDAVEPNTAMREEGIKATRNRSIVWHQGCGENTGLVSNNYDWLLMGSSFHWTNPNQSLPEFYRVLKSKQYLTLLWNPRDIERCPLQMQIENMIYEKAPHLKRKSSGSKRHAEDWSHILESTGHFKDVFFLEEKHDEIMTRQRYLGAWNSVNDIQAQAGPKKWKEIIETIEKITAPYDEIRVPYKTRSWTAIRKD